MADVRPIPALYFDPARVESIEAVIAPPYDVIDPEQRQALLARSSHNVVEIDLPESPDGGDRYAHAAATMREWRGQGVLTTDPEPTLWGLTQAYTAPDGSSHERHAILARVGAEEYGAGRVRPHERTQPGPKQDRLDLTRATGHNLSPIFSLTSVDAWPLLEPATDDVPWAETVDPDGTVNRVWRVTDPAIHAAVAETLASAELLIADGHHRYETARTFAAEVEAERDGADGGSDAHRFTLMALTGLEDPGLTVFPTHRLLKGLDAEQLEALEGRLGEAFEMTPVEADRIDPADAEEGPGVLGYTDARRGRHFLLRLRDRAELDRALSDRSAAYRDLDAVVLETLVLREMLGMSEDDIAAKRGIGYAKSLAELRTRLDTDEYQAGFVLRPTPVEAVRKVAAAGETMPPKSTYFYPKIPTGLVFNPVR
ncbi:MAG TPA: DUF1015 domain-containing protein [Solirubrobacterales bacterium]|nr:DUF1015 domain-containing protein [Solirubrobacterales bacterium]